MNQVRCMIVKTTATRAGVDNKWMICLAKFESGCNALQLAAFGLGHHKTNDFGKLFTLCQALAETEARDVGVVGAGIKTDMKRCKTENARVFKCYNCSNTGHLADLCPKPFTETSYKYWNACEIVKPSVKAKLNEYKSLREKNKKKPRKTNGTPAQKAARKHCKSSDDSVKDVRSDYRSSNDSDYASYLVFKANTKKINKNNSQYFACITRCNSDGESLARRAGAINGLPSHSIIFDSGAGKTIVAEKFVKRTRWTTTPM